MTAGLFSAFFNSGSYFCLFYIWIRSKAFRHLGSQFSQHTDLTGHCSRTRPKRPFRADFPVQRESKPVLSGRCPNRLAVFTAHRPDWTLFKDTSGASVRAAFPVRRASKPVLSGRCPSRPMGVCTAHRPDWTLFKDTSEASVRAAFPVQRASKPVLSGRCPNI